MTFEKASFHRLLVTDTERSYRYRDAIFQTVKPGDHVLDMGTGSGLLAFFACQAGAEKVYAVEQTNVIDLAQRLAQANGLASKIEFLQTDLRQLTLPRTVDVVVSELISKALIGQHFEELTALARERFLRPGGSIVPNRVTLFVAPVTAEDDYQSLGYPAEAYGLDFAEANKTVFNTVYSFRLQPEALLADAQAAYQVDSYRVDGTEHPHAQLAFEIGQPGVLHGWAAWFEAELAPGVHLTNFPFSESWDHQFFPLLQPQKVEAGMTARLALRGKQPVGEPIIWRWTTLLSHGDEMLAEYRQSNFPSMLFSDSSLEQLHSLQHPELLESGRKILAIVEGLDGSRSIEAISQALCSKRDSGITDPAAAKAMLLRLLGVLRETELLKTTSN